MKVLTSAFLVCRAEFVLTLISLVKYSYLCYLLVPTAWSIFLYPLTQILCVSLKVKSIFSRQHRVEPCF